MASFHLATVNSNDEVFMSNCFWACEECGNLWDSMLHELRCPKCSSARIWFDSELEAQDHVEVWPIDDDSAIVIEKDEDGNDEGPTVQ